MTTPEPVPLADTGVSLAEAIAQALGNPEQPTQHLETPTNRTMSKQDWADAFEAALNNHHAQ